MNYKIDWASIIESYREKPLETAKKFLEEFPIDWALFDPSEFLSLEEYSVDDIFKFCKQQSWSIPDTLSYEEFAEIIKLIIATDDCAPEEALLGIIPDYWFSCSIEFETDYTLFYAVISNPNSSESILTAIANGLSEDFLTLSRVLLSSDIPEKFLEVLFEVFTSFPYFHPTISDLADVPNISKELLEKIALYVLDFKPNTPSEILRIYNTIEVLLHNKKAVKKYRRDLERARVYFVEKL